MRGTSGVAFAIGVAVIAIVIGGIFYMQRGDKIDLPGKILKVRTAVLDDGKSDRGPDHDATSVAVVDFRVTNPSDVIFEVRTVSVQMQGADGKTYVRARTHWAIIDKASGRPIRVPPQVVAPFVGAE